MKPFLIKVDVAPEQSFKVRSNVNPLYYNEWHYHEELELTYIQKGTGIRFVGDSIESFGAGDLILLGSNLPHFWRSDSTSCSEAGAEETCEAMVVQFKPDFWGEAFLELPELNNTKELFLKAKQGLRITGKTRELVSELMQKLSGASGLNRILLLLQIIQSVSDSAETSFLSSVGFSSSLNETETRRISSVYSYTLENFTRKVKLEEVAAVANMTPNAFCRYFKTHTRKTYSQFLLEIRIGQACKLLIEHQLPIGQVCLESGFQNFSNFNRYFKAITKLTPQAYQKLHRKR